MYSGYEVEDFYKLNSKNSMENGIGKINWINVKSALVNGVCAMVLFFVISVVASVLQHNSIFGIDWKDVIDKGVMAALAVFAVMLSLFRNFFTTNDGNFAGVVKVIQDTNENK